MGKENKETMRKVAKQEAERSKQSKVKQGASVAPDKFFTYAKYGLGVLFSLAGVGIYQIISWFGGF